MIFIIIVIFLDLNFNIVDGEKNKRYSKHIKFVTERVLFKNKCNYITSTITNNAYPYEF